MAAADQSPAVRPPGFVGRDREMLALAEAMRTPPAAVLVSGDPGIGKSRLLSEFLASGSGLRSLVADCPPFRQPYTLGPIVEAIRQAVDDVSGLPLTGLTGALRAIFPEWAADLPPAPDPLDDPSAARYRLFGALAELIGCLDTRVLVVEDLQWADDTTLEFLLFLTARRSSRLCLALTYRPRDVAPDSLLLRLSSRPPAGHTHLHLQLAPLDVTQTAALMSSMLADEPVSAGFAGFVHACTEGFPLAVEESVRLMADRCDLTRRDGEWVRRRIDKIRVPPLVRDAVLERVARIGADALAVLRAAAVLAEPADEMALAAVAGVSHERAVPALSTALETGLLAEVVRHGLAFRHVLAAQAVHDATPATVRRQLHLRAGQVLETTAPVPAARLARHFREAGQHAAWCRYAEQAADLALASWDHSAALRLLHEVITSGKAPAASLNRLAGKLPMTPLLSEEENHKLIEALRVVLAEGPDGPGEQASARFMLARAYIGINDIQTAMAECTRALPLLPEDSPDRVSAMLLVGWPRDGTTARSDHRAWLAQAADAIGGLPPQFQLRFGVGVISGLLSMGDDDGWAQAARLPADAVDAGDLMHLTRGALNIADGALLWGRYQQAGQLLARGSELARQHQFARLAIEIELTVTELRWFRGDWTGLADVADALATAEDLDSLGRAWAALIRGQLWLTAGELPQAARCFEHALDEARRRGYARYYMEPAAALARVRLAEGRAAESAEVTAEAAEVLIRKDMWFWGLDLVPVRVSALIAAGRAAEAGEFAARFAAALTGSTAPAVRPAVLATQASLAAAAGHSEQAARLYRQAAASWRELPRPYDALLATEQQGCHLLTAGNRSEGARLLEQARRELTALGAVGDADRVARHLRVNGIAAPRPWLGGRRGYGPDLSPRELDVVRLVVTGRTNKEIAAVLHRSPATVAAQLRSAMRKLGVSTRTALAVRAAEAGITPGSVLTDGDYPIGEPRQSPSRGEL